MNERVNTSGGINLGASNPKYISSGFVFLASILLLLVLVMQVLPYLDHIVEMEQIEIVDVEESESEESNSEENEKEEWNVDQICDVHFYAREASTTLHRNVAILHLVSAEPLSPPPDKA